MSNSFSKYGTLIVMMSVVIFGAYSVFNTSIYPLCNADTSCYLGLSESIVEHKTYTFNFEPHTKYPPVFPLILSAFRSLKIASTDRALIIFTSFIGLLGVLFSYQLLKKYNPAVALFSSILMLTSPHFFYVSTRTILSDLPFFSLTMITILTGHALLNVNSYIKSVLYFFIFCISMTASEMTRTIGVALPLSAIVWLIYLSLNCRHASVQALKLLSIPILIAIISQVIWLLWCNSKATILNDGQYMDSYFMQIKLINPHIPELGLATISDFIIRLVNNLRINTAYISSIILHFGVYPSYFSIFIFPFLFLLVVGMVYRIINKNADLVFWYFIFYSAILLVWPFNEGHRFVLPVFPIACLFIAEGIYHALKSCKSDDSIVRKFGAATVSIQGFISFYMLLNGKCSNQQLRISCLFWILCITIIVLRIVLKEYIPKIHFFLKQKCQPALSRIRIWFIVYCAAALICAVGISEQYKIATDTRNQNFQKKPNHSLILAAQWIKEYIPQQSIICATQKEIISHYSKRKTVLFPVSSSNELLLKSLQQFNVDFLVIYNEGKYPYFFPTDIQRLQILIKNKPLLLSKIYHTADCSIYKINRTAL